MVVNRLSKMGSRTSITDEDLQSASSSIDKKINVTVNSAGDSIDNRKMVEKQTTKSLPQIHSGLFAKDSSSTK
jgi:hypothetical protein